MCNSEFNLLIYFVSVVWICWVFYIVFFLGLPAYCFVARLFSIAISVYCLSPVSLFQPYCHSEVTSCGEIQAHALQWNVSPSIICFISSVCQQDCARLAKAQETNPKKTASYFPLVLC